MNQPHSSKHRNLCTQNIRLIVPDLLICCFILCTLVLSGCASRSSFWGPISRANRNHADPFPAKTSLATVETATKKNETTPELRTVAWEENSLRTNDSPKARKAVLQDIPQEPKQETVAQTKNSSVQNAQAILEEPAPIALQYDDNNAVLETMDSLTENAASHTQAFEQENTYPIGLANALALAGANSLEIELAREKILEAEARYDKAAVMVLPSLRFGVVYNKHDGRLQETEGNVIEVNRNSLFLGGGAGYNGIPLAAGTSGPARLAMNLSLADAAFEPLVACQLVEAESAASQATESNTLLAVALAYFNLVEANAMLSNSEQTAAMAEQMSQHVSTFAEEGFSSKAEVSRAKAEAAYWQQLVETARRNTIKKSAALARLVRLPPQVQLMPIEVSVVPVDLVDADSPVDVLVARGLASRPEISRQDAIAQAAGWRSNQEDWRPWLPHVQIGVSAGSFGGGPSTTFNQGGRSDVDLLAVWELENFGLGTNAKRRLRQSQHYQAELASEIVRDHIAEEIVSAAADVNGLRRQIKLAQGAIAPAEQSYALNEDRIREGEGLPVEVIQSIRALSAARAAHAKAVLDYNRAQYRLLHALGEGAAR